MVASATPIMVTPMMPVMVMPVVTPMMPMMMPVVMMAPMVMMMVAPTRLGGGGECEGARDNERHENSLHGFLS